MFETLFDISRNGDRWECRPVRLWVNFNSGMLVLAAGFCLWMAGMFFSFYPDSTSMAVGTVPLAIAMLLGWQTWRLWRLGRVPLTVESGGRVSYDGKELCGPGTVRTVHLVPDMRPESGDCRVVFETNDGGKVALEGLYFGT